MIDPVKYPSTRPAPELPDDVLVSVALQCAGRLAMYDTKAHFDRVTECHAELLRRLATIATLQRERDGLLGLVRDVNEYIAGNHPMKERIAAAIEGAKAP